MHGNLSAFQFMLIKNEITEENISQMISQAHVMECEYLLDEMYEMLINEILTPDNASIFYLDAIAVSIFIIIHSYNNYLWYSLDLISSRKLVNR